MHLVSRACILNILKFIIFNLSIFYLFDDTEKILNHSASLKAYFDKKCMCILCLYSLNLHFALDIILGDRYDAKTLKTTILFKLNLFYLWFNSGTLTF